jgi:hypothetical protein
VIFDPAEESCESVFIGGNNVLPISHPMKDGVADEPQCPEIHWLADLSELAHSPFQLFQEIL